MPLPFSRTLRLKVRSESYGWLDAAAGEVNQVFNYCNATSFAAATRTDRKRTWLTGYDLCNLTAGATEYFDRIGADTIQRTCTEYARKRASANHYRLRWRVSRGARRSLGWIPFKATSLKRKGHALRFCGKTFRIFERGRFDGERLEPGRFYREAQRRLGQLQKRGRQRQAKRLHRKIRRQRQAACHKFSRKIVETYRNIFVGDVSSTKLAKTRMAKAVLDSGWGMLKRMLRYKGEHAGRFVHVVDERNTTRACSSCGALTGPSGLRHLAVRRWECANCGESHDRDVNAARNILTAGSRCRTSVCGNESALTVCRTRQTSGLRGAIRRTESGGMSIGS
jgi:putative transposase